MERDHLLFPLHKRLGVLYSRESLLGSDRMTLAGKHCIPCRGGSPPLSEKEIAPLLSQLKDGWRVVQGHHLEKEYTFRDFKSALDFVVKVGACAEQEGHHPDITLAWGKVVITLWTHKIDGLTESDFVLALMCDREYQSPHEK